MLSQEFLKPPKVMPGPVGVKAPTAKLLSDNLYDSTTVAPVEAVAVPVYVPLTSQTTATGGQTVGGVVIVSVLVQLRIITDKKITTIEYFIN